MLGKSSHATVIISLLLATAVLIIVPEAAFAIGGPAPASIFIWAEPESQVVHAGGSAIFKVTVYTQSSWKTGNVSLNLLNPPPQWITATFSHGEVTNVTPDGFTSNLEVKVAPDAPQKNVTLTIHGTGTTFGFYQKNGAPIPIKLDAQTDVALKITAPPNKYHHYHYDHNLGHDDNLDDNPVNHNHKHDYCNIH